MYISGNCLKKKKTLIFGSGNFIVIKFSPTVTDRGAEGGTAGVSHGTAWPVPGPSHCGEDQGHSATLTYSRPPPWHKDVDRRMAECFCGDFILRFSVHKKVLKQYTVFPT